MTTKPKDPGIFTIMLIVAGIAVFGAWIKEPSDDAAKIPDPPTKKQPAAGPRPDINVGGKNKVIAVSFGCQDEDTFDKVSRFQYEHDEQAFSRALLEQISIGQCTLFKKDEIVFVDHASWTVLQLRRPGDTVAFWTAMETITGPLVNP